MPDIDLKFDKLDSVDDLTKAIRELDKKFKLK